MYFQSPIRVLTVVFPPTARLLWIFTIWKNLADYTTLCELLDKKPLSTPPIDVADR